MMLQDLFPWLQAYEALPGIAIPDQALCDASTWYGVLMQYYTNLVCC